MSLTVALRPGQPPERDPKLFCPEHWERINWSRRAWALVFATNAIQTDHRLVAELGGKPSRRTLEKVLLIEPACCRLGARAEHLFR